MPTPYFLYEEQLQQIKAILLETFDGEDVKIILLNLDKPRYSRNSMEVAIGILPRSPYNRKKLIYSMEKIEEINFPYTVDIIDLSKVSESFRTHLLEGSDLWKDWD
jgi:hypothetical protein